MTRLLSLAAACVFAAAAPAQVATARAVDNAAPAGFKFVEEKGKYVDLLFGDRKVMRYMNTPHDTTTKDTHELTFKPFHHVYDPATGETLLTNGAGLAADKALLYPHHRGLFFAFNKVSYGEGKNEKCDVWHGHNGEFVSHDKFLKQDAGADKAVQTSALSWHGTDGKVFANEERTYTVYNAPGGTMIDFNSTLTTPLDKVKLDGDPQHSGFHFRAAMEVKDHGKKDTYYLRPDGKGKMGEERNWDPSPKANPSKDPRTINLPWNAMSFVIAGKRYTVLRIDHPTNPKESRGSERYYGRFGDYFEWNLTPTTPLKIKYRVWVQEGEMTVEKCAELAKEFTKG
jgi:hypothetical protein